MVSVDVARKKKQEEQDHQEEAIVTVEDSFPAKDVIISFTHTYGCNPFIVILARYKV